MIKSFLLLFCIIILCSSDYSCRYASQFSLSELIKDQEVQNEFIENVAYWEGHFHQDGVGMNWESGLTYDGHPFNYTTGELIDTPHLFSASSKESIHINLLTLALFGDTRAQIFVNFSNPEGANNSAIEILTNKIRSYEDFNIMYPGFGGFFPWFAVNDSGMSLLWNWKDTVPALDNGQLVWAIYALIPVLAAQGQQDLSNRYQKQFDLMVQNAKPIFYEGEGKIRAVTQIGDVEGPVEGNNYTNSGGGYLDDPYEGELFAFFLDLFQEWKNETERDEIWIYKRPMLQSVNYESDSGNITVQRGYWFSAHEQWKLLVLPYLTVPIAKRVFTNCERARTLHSYIFSIPGLYASVTDVHDVGYISATGIESIAFEEVDRTDVITPYGSMPGLLINLGFGLAWYQNMLLGPRMQGPYGSTESVLINGSAVCAIGTWDSKITSLDAMLGGIWKINQDILDDQGLLERFNFVVNREYSRVFTDIQGEDIDLSLPSAQIPIDELGFFTECQL